jgi:hypothetical protein
MLLAIIPLGWLTALNARKKERENAHPLIPPRLLQLRSVRFGILIAMLFFSVWSGFMFCMALTMQTGLGMAPWQSGNSFIALGVTYFISAWFAPRLIARYSTSTILLTGLAIQIAGLLALIATFRVWGMENTALTLAPATGLVGYGQALIVNSFYRIGMRDIQPDDAGPRAPFSARCSRPRWGLARPFLARFCCTRCKPSRGLHPGGERLPDGGNGDDGGACPGDAAHPPSPVPAGGEGLPGHQISPGICIIDPQPPLWGCINTGDVMQELIAQVEELGIEINHTTSLVIIFGIIFLTAIIVHFILHKVVLRAFEKRAQASSHLWLQIITQNKLFHRLAFTLQGIIVNVQAVLWLQKGSEAAEILTTCAKLWVMVYALLSFFSLLDVIFNLSQKMATASQLPLKGIFQGIKLVSAILVGILIISC